MQVVGHKLTYYFVHMNEFVPFSTSLQSFPANFRESFLTVRLCIHGQRLAVHFRDDQTDI